MHRLKRSDPSSPCAQQSGTRSEPMTTAPRAQATSSSDVYERREARGLRAALSGLVAHAARRWTPRSESRPAREAAQRELTSETQDSIQTLGDAEYLLAIAIGHPDSRVATAAAQRVSVLSGGGRRTATLGPTRTVTEFERNGHAGRIAREAKSWVTRRFATEQIADPELLLSIARSDAMPEVRSAAVLRLKNEEVLVSIALEEECLAVSAAAIEGIQSERARAEVAKKASDWRAREAAMNRCATPELFEDRLAHDPEPRVRSRALQRILQQGTAHQDSLTALLLRVATRDATELVAKAATAAIASRKDASRLAVIARTALVPAVRVEALRLLSPKDTVLPLDRLNEDPDASVQAEAIRQLRCPTTLADIMARPRLPAALRQLAGQTWHRRTLEQHVDRLERLLAEQGGLPTRFDEKILRLAAEASGVVSMGLYDGGRAENTMADTAHVLRRAFARPTDDEGMAERMGALPTPVLEALDVRALVARTNAAPEVYGRTLVVTSVRGERIALKLAKRGEDPRLLLASLDASPLTREWKMHHLLTRLSTSLGLESAPTAPIGNGPFLLRGIPKSWIAAVQEQARKPGCESFELACDGAEHFAIGYRHPEDHHTYLNDPRISARQFREATARGLGDAARLMSAGLFPTVSADFMHNASEQRSYHWNTDDLRAPPRETHARSLGAGRLHAWRTCVACVNFRVSGLADPKYLYLARDLIDHSRRRERLALHASDEARLLAEASIMGDLLFAWALTAADSALARHEALARGETGIEPLDLVAELRHGLEVFVSRYAGLAPEIARKLITASGIDFPRMANQFEAFTGKGAFEPLATNGALGDALERELFGDHVELLYEGRNAIGRWLTLRQGRGFQAALGWSTDGENQDLGPVNGPFPVQELIRALFLITSFAPVAARFEPRA